ncbi:WD domain, G-beta repeat containing protein [Entamoeba histolytica HM-1:IMSS-B]|uniref:WD domain containing protein n=6 Tax=Entamoeba histolytica TaxID=5759 RepID=C4M7I9_ENTH1|nr:WD domain containing protein [Entamoeba histolytica HM-1:IMSS]EMD44309.1 WD domain containing protein [Entamoeba histolytica KU27]EMH74496.1 WD domain, G-beta repeat containing protein [Entamoeba histolytica HM-1:IMSS-B]EMS11629.1 WD domain, G-beta repeat-containing protein [Entamoeba histolytica HM-3:IMSS]ENY61309.1 WD domain, G-beta repeat-containing protein [Entamoeba histolytica HM-1:IMSS-A]GAT97500.1 WD domain containing protein [Entamoeba histolytica]|eukprot:XP_648311.1 WD domain containing protein [Entamoeba histolytica HM-1:IMSS]
MKCHITQFGRIVPSGIERLCYSPDNKYLACTREDGIVEIYLSKTKSLLHQLPIFPSKHSCCAACWSDTTLFVGGTTKQVFGINPETGMIKTSINVSSNVTCLAYSESLFIGTDKEFIEFYSPSQDDPDSLWLMGRLNHSKGKTTCINIKGELVFAGTSEGVIFGWIKKQKKFELIFAVYATDRLREVKYNKSRDEIAQPLDEIRRLEEEKIPENERKTKSTAIMAIEIMDQRTVAVGLVYGKIQIWDIVTMTIIAEFREHQADVLCLKSATLNGEAVLFGSGVDHKIVLLKEVNGKWTCCGRVRQHSHTVKSLDISNEGILVSGGVDTIILFRSINDMNQLTYRIFPIGVDSPKAKVCSTADMVVVHEVDNNFNFYQLAIPSTECEKGKYEIDREYSCYFTMKLSKKHQITTFDLNSQCSILVVGTKDLIRIFGIDKKTAPWNIIKEDINVNGVVKKVYVNNNCLITIMTDGTIITSEINFDGKELTIKEEKRGIFSPMYSIYNEEMNIIGLTELKNGQCQLVLIDLNTMESKSIKLIGEFIPKKVTKKDKMIYVTGIKGEFICYNYDNYTVDPRTTGIKKITSQNEIGSERIYFDPLCEDNFVVLSRETITYENIHSKIHKGQFTWSKLNNLPRTLETISQFPSKISKKYGIIVGGGFNLKGDLIVVTQQWLSILQSLPEPFRFYNKMNKLVKVN